VIAGRQWKENRRLAIGSSTDWPSAWIYNAVGREPTCR
jgi:hypothetical protein